MRLTQAGEALVRHAAGILAGLTAAEEEVAAIAGPAGRTGPAGLLPQRQLHPGPDRPRRPARRPPRHPGLAGRGRTAALRGDAARGRLRHRAGLPLRGRGGRGRVGRPGGPPAAHRPAGRPGARGAPAGRRGAGRRIAELADEPWIAGCPRCRAPAGRGLRERRASPRASTSRPTTTRRWSAWWARVWASRSCPSSPSSPYGPRGARAVTLRTGRPSGEIVALTLPDLAQVPAVAATLDRAGAARALRLGGT